MSVSETAMPQIPENYEFLHFLGQGGFGKVLKCRNKENGETVAVKIPSGGGIFREGLMMRFLMSKNLHKFNIVEFKTDFFINRTPGLVYEMLDISLFHYINSVGLMWLAEIRTIIEQLAVAFDKLKDFGIIHGDLKPDNIMLVDHVRQPMKIKLIDFGLALSSEEAIQGSRVQTAYFRAPEVRLRAPLSEAIDIWSLGCVMADMMFDVQLFHDDDYEGLGNAIGLLGPPPKHLLEKSWRWQKFFNITDNYEFLRKTPEEYYQYKGDFYDSTLLYTSTFWDEKKMERLESDNKTEADDRREAIELMKAMFQWDGNDRITPAGILNHPFITRSYLKTSCCEPEPTTSQATAVMTPELMTAAAGATTIVQVEDCEPEPTTSQATSVVRPAMMTPVMMTAAVAAAEGATIVQVEDCPEEELPPDVIMVQSEDPVNQIHQGDLPMDNHDMSSDSPRFTTKTSDVNNNEPQTKPMKKKKKKKSSFKRFLSWLKKKFN